MAKPGRESIKYPTTIAYDPKLRKPACVLLAAGMGADANVANAFNTNLWLVAPTVDMQVLPIPDETFLDQLIQVTELANAR